MFLQNYMYQAATAIMYAHTQPEKLHATNDKSTAINWDAIHYGEIELRARMRRYLHFALPCMVYDLWVRGLRKDHPTFAHVQKKTSEMALFLDKLCYGTRDLAVVRTREDDVIGKLWVTSAISVEDITKLQQMLRSPNLATASTRNIPFFDDGHGYSFFKDNTPYDASYNLLLDTANYQATADPSRDVPVPNVDLIFGHDDYFVIDRFANAPNDCLGPTRDSSIIKKIQLMMGPDYVKDIALTSIKDLREMGLWRPTEFDQLMLVGGTTISGAIKSAFSGVTAPMAIYWSWCERVTHANCPLNTAQWVHKELCDRIAPSEVYNIALDKTTMQWLFDHNIAAPSTEVTDDLFMFPNYDRNKYASRSTSEQKLTLEQWAWSPEHAHKMPKSTGVKIVGKAHSSYDIAWDPIASVGGRTHTATTESRVSSGPAAYGRSRDIAGKARDALSSRAKEFLQWAHETVASQDTLINILESQAAAPDITTGGVDIPRGGQSESSPSRDKTSSGGAGHLDLGRSSTTPATETKPDTGKPVPSGSSKSSTPLKPNGGSQTVKTLDLK